MTHVLHRVISKSLWNIMYLLGLTKQFCSIAYSRDYLYSYPYEKE